MIMRRELGRWEGMLFGFLMGVFATVVAIFVWHHAVGMVHVNAFKRAVASQNLERLADLLDEQVTMAELAFEDGRPLPMSEHLAFHFARTLYRHHMRYSRDLLERGEIDRFNELRMTTGFMLLDLSGERLAGLSLVGANFSGASLDKTDFGDADLTDCTFAGSEMPSAILTGARVMGAHFDLANLAGANLNRIHGSGTTFIQAVLAGASLQQITALDGVRFDAAVLDDSSLFRSRLPDAVLDGASLLMVSAVDADLSEIASMSAVDLTGANLSGARLQPTRMERAWLTGADGLDPGVALELAANGSVLEPEQVLELVDPRIVDGFRAQVESSGEIPVDARQRVLINWLKGYYLQ